MPQIEVTFDIDANGIVHVSAKDKATGKEQSVRIEASGGLTDSEIETMVKDAEAHASEDKVRRELVEVRNQAEAMIHATEKTLEENKDNDKVAAVKDEVEAAITSAKEAMAGEDTEAIQTTLANLTQVSMKIGEAVYAGQQQAAEEAAESDAASESPAGDDVVDADFEEVDDDKKSA